MAACISIRRDYGDGIKLVVGRGHQKFPDKDLFTFWKVNAQCGLAEASRRAVPFRVLTVLGHILYVDLEKTVKCFTEHAKNATRSVQEGSRVIHQANAVKSCVFFLVETARRAAY